MTAKFYGFERSFLHDTTEEDSWVIDMVRSSEYVKLESDVAALQEQVRALAAEANYLRNEIKQHSASVHFCEVCGKDDPCKTDDVCCSLNHPLPSTDAVIREIRAQAVESYANYSDECYGTHDKSGEDARVYAARIRAGEQS